MQGRRGTALHFRSLAQLWEASAESEASTRSRHVGMHAASLDDFDDAWGCDDGMAHLSFDRWLSDCVLRGLYFTMQKAPLTAKANTKVLVL